MQKNNRKRHREAKKHFTIGELRSNEIRIDRIGKKFVVESTYIKRKSPINWSPQTKLVFNRKFGVLEFNADDKVIGAVIEKLIRLNHNKGGRTYLTSRVLNGESGDIGVWPPFMPKDIDFYVMDVKNSKDIK